MANITKKTKRPKTNTERNCFKLLVKDVFVLQDVRLYQKIQTMQRVRSRKSDAYEKDGRVKTDKSTAMKKQASVQCPSRQRVKHLIQEQVNIVKVKHSCRKSKTWYKPLL